MTLLLNKMIAYAEKSLIDLKKEEELLIKNINKATSNIFIAAWMYLNRSANLNYSKHLHKHDLNPNVHFLHDDLYRDRYGSTHPVYLLHYDQLASFTSKHHSMFDMRSIWKKLVEDDNLYTGYGEWFRSLDNDAVYKHLKKHSGHGIYLIEHDLISKEPIIIITPDAN